MQQGTERMFEGVLRRSPSGWRWMDGEPAEHVRDLRLGDVLKDLPTERVDGIEMTVIPMRWRSMLEGVPARVSGALADRVVRLIRHAGEPRVLPSLDGASMFDDSGGLFTQGWPVRAAAWNDAASEICGPTWASGDEPAVLGHARRLGWRG
jgi:hypothetical protein